jgi:hypothetical protein
MATKEEQAKEELLSMINAFYRFAGVDLPRLLDINDSVAAAFFEMMDATAKCSKAFAWIPQPPKGPPGVMYFVGYIRGAVFNTFMGRVSVSCAREVIRSYRSKLEGASMGA